MPKQLCIHDYENNFLSFWSNHLCCYFPITFKGLFYSELSLDSLYKPTNWCTNLVFQSLQLDRPSVSFFEWMSIWTPIFRLCQSSTQKQSYFYNELQYYHFWTKKSLNISIIKSNCLTWWSCDQSFWDLWYNLVSLLFFHHKVQSYFRYNRGLASWYC